MEITVIGSGTSVPSVKRASPSLMISCRSIKILCDTGPGTLRQLAKNGTALNEIDLLAYSHFHVDHIADLVPFIFASKYAPGLARERDLTVIGPVGLQQFYERLVAAYGPSILPIGFNIRWVEAPLAGFEYGEIGISSTPVRHTETSVAYRFEDCRGRSVVYSGDTEDCAEIVDLARACDILVLECAFPDDMKREGHLTPSSAGRIAAAAGCKKLVLTHFYPPCDDRDLLSSVKEFYSGQVVLSEDLLRIRS